MNIVLKSFVRPFYRENAGTFFFLVTVMFLCVGPLDGASVIRYHYSLIMGMLQSKQFLLIVVAGWLLYVRKCAAFVRRTLGDPAFLFLQIYNSQRIRHRYTTMVIVQLALLAPVLVYGIAVAGVAWWHGWYRITSLLLVLFVLLTAAPAAWYLKVMQHIPAMATQRFRLPVWLSIGGRWNNSYPAVLLQFIRTDQKMIYAGIKIFTCGLLFGMVLNNSASDYDWEFPFVFFNFGVVANGIIIYRTRIFEETRLSFSRSMPVHLLTRFAWYAIIYGLLMLPEWLTILFLYPDHLHATDAWNFALCGYGTVMLLNSISFLDDFSMKGYLRAVLVVIAVEYFFIIAGALTALAGVFLVSACVIFCGAYYSFEKARGQIGQ